MTPLLYPVHSMHRPKSHRNAGAESAFTLGLRDKLCMRRKTFMGGGPTIIERKSANCRMDVASPPVPSRGRLARPSIQCIVDRSLRARTPNGRRVQGRSTKRLEAVEKCLDISCPPCRRVRANLERPWKSTRPNTSPPGRFAHRNDRLDGRVRLGIADDVDQSQKAIVKKTLGLSQGSSPFSSGWGRASTTILYQSGLGQNPVNCLGKLL